MDTNNDDDMDRSNRSVPLLCMCSVELQKKMHTTVARMEFTAECPLLQPAEVRLASSLCDLIVHNVP